jgi:hypothetical protein
VGGVQAWGYCVKRVEGERSVGGGVYLALANLMRNVRGDTAASSNALLGKITSAAVSYIIPGAAHAGVTVVTDRPPMLR